MTAATVVPPARFAEIPAGWHVTTTAPIVVVDGVGQGATLATNWVANLSDAHGWAAQLRPGRVAINVELIRRATFCAAPSHRLHVPLMLADAQRATLEGSAFAEDRFAGRVGAYEVDLRVDYGAARPSRSVRRRVQRMLSALRFPRWGVRCGGVR